jgi:hypothetical protein
VLVLSRIGEPLYTDYPPSPAASSHCTHQASRANPTDLDQYLDLDRCHLHHWDRLPFASLFLAMIRPPRRDGTQSFLSSAVTDLVCFSGLFRYLSSCYFLTHWQPMLSDCASGFHIYFHMS